MNMRVALGTVAFTLAVVAARPVSAQAWAERQTLLADVPGKWDGMSHIVSVSGSTALLTIPGKGNNKGGAHIFVLSGSQWQFQASVVASDGKADDSFGVGGAVSGNLAVVTSTSLTGKSKAYVFVRNGNSWTEESKFTIGGATVALDGETLAVGSAFGLVEVYQRSGSSWPLQAVLLPGGDKLDLEGDLLVVGDRGDDTAGYDAGAVRVFERSGTTWTETALITASDAQNFDDFGISVEYDQDRIFVGSNSSKGSVYHYERYGSSWQEQQKLTLNSTKNNSFGVDCSSRGDLLVIGEPGVNQNTGAAHLFFWDGSRWSAANSILASNAETNASFGSAVELAGNQVLIGAKREDVAGFVDAGVGYVFDIGTSVNYCTAGLSASGCQPTLYALGAASASSANGFTLSASSVEGSKRGQFFFGVSGKQANPWGTGTSFQCVAPPVKRLGMLDKNGTTGSCDGSFAQDLNAYWTANPGKNPGASVVAQAQFWYRDPLNTSNQTTSLTDAVEFWVAP